MDRSRPTHDKLVSEQARSHSIARRTDRPYPQGFAFFGERSIGMTLGMSVEQMQGTPSLSCLKGRLCICQNRNFVLVGSHRGFGRDRSLDSSLLGGGG
jgi:hypothetical protein